MAPEFEHDIRREHEQRHEVEDRDLVDEDPREEGVRELTDVELVEVRRARCFWRSGPSPGAYARALLS